MITVNVTELRRRFSFYIRKVKAGKTVRITIHGKAVADICPIIGTNSVKGKK